MSKNRDIQQPFNSLNKEGFHSTNIQLKKYVAPLTPAEQAAKKIIERQKNRFKWFEFIKTILRNPLGFFLNENGNYNDYYNTYFRTIEVYSNVYDNRTNDDKESQLSFFNWLFKTNGERSELTTAGWIAFSLGFVALLFGWIPAFYNFCRGETFASLQHAKEQAIKKKIVSEEITDEQFEAHQLNLYAYFIENKKILDQPEAITDLDVNRPQLVPKEISKWKTISAEDLKVKLENDYKSDPFAQFATLMAVFDDDKDIFTVLSIPDMDDEAWDKLSLWDKFCDRTERVISTTYTVLKIFGDAINANSYLFWLTFFPFVWKVGITAASSALYMPTIIGISVGTYLLFTIPVVIYKVDKAFLDGKIAETLIKVVKFIKDEVVEAGTWIKNKIVAPYKWFKNDVLGIEDDPEVIDEPIQINPELTEKETVAQRKIDNKIMRKADMKAEHQHNMRYLMGSKYKVRTQEEKEDKVEKYPLRAAAAAPAVYYDLKKSDIENSSLGQHLLVGSDSIYLLSIITEVVNVVILASFAFWWLSSVLTAVAAVIPGLDITNTSLFSFLGSNTAAAEVGFGLASFFVIKEIAFIKRKNMEHQQDIHKQLSKNYKGEPFIHYFTRMERSVEFKKAQAEWLRLKVLQKKYLVNNTSLKTLTDDRNKNFDDLEKDFKEISEKCSADYFKAKYTELHAQRVLYEQHLRNGFHVHQNLDEDLKSHLDLEDVDVYNYENRRKLCHKADEWSWIEKIGSYIHYFLAGMQTGSLLARTLFLKDCIFALWIAHPQAVVIAGTSVAALVTGGTVLTGGAMWAFFGVAAAIAGLYALVRCAQHYVNDKRKQQEYILENIDELNGYLNKQDKELNALTEHLNEQVSGKKVVRDIVRKQSDPVVIPFNKKKFDNGNDYSNRNFLGDAINHTPTIANPSIQVESNLIVVEMGS